MGWSISDNQPEFVAFWKETCWGGDGGDWKPLSFCSWLCKSGTFQRQYPIASLGTSFHLCNGKRCPWVRGPQCPLLRLDGPPGSHSGDPLSQTAAYWMEFREVGERLECLPCTESIPIRFFSWKWKWSLTLCNPVGYVAHQAPPSMGFSRQEYWSGLPFPSPGDLPDSGIEPRSPTLQADALTSEPPGILILRTPQMVNLLSGRVCLNVGSFTNSKRSQFTARVPDQVVVV